MAISKIILNDVTQMDVTDTTATAGDVINKYFYGADGVKTLGTASGGGTTEAPVKDVNFIDYDGTVVYSYTAAEFANLSELPANPTHTGLTAQGWNWTKPQITAQLTAMPGQPVWVGQMYVTASGDTEIDIVLEDSNLLTPYLKITVNGTVTVDWGDDSATDTVTGTSLTASKYTPHTYQTTGEYTIKIHVASGEFSFNNYYILSHTNSNDGNQPRRYNNAITAMRLGNGITTIGGNSFFYCYGLRSITIPSGVTSIGVYSFYNCVSLRSITLPNELTSIGNYTFAYCTALEKVSIPSGVTSIGHSVFVYCYPLQSVTLPSGLTSWGDGAFNSCYNLRSIAIPSAIETIGSTEFSANYSLRSITIPSGITTIGASAFSNNYSAYKLVFKPSAPPTVNNSNAFTSLPTDCIIYVPTGSLNAYKTASNYPSSSTYTYVEQ